MNVTDRLNKIGDSLTPDQAIAAHLEDAHRFGDFKKYQVSVLEHLKKDDRPELVLARPVANAAVRRAKDQPPEKARKAGRAALRKTLFLYYLVEEIAGYFERIVDVIDLEGLLGYATYLLARSQRRPGNKTARERTLDSACQFFFKFAKEMLTFKDALEQLQEKHFSGRRILWKSQEEALKRQLRLVEQMAVEWQQIFMNIWKAIDLARLRGELKIEGGRIGYDREKAPEDFVRFVEPIDPNKLQQVLVYRARINALREMGQRGRALEFVRALHTLLQ